MVKNDIQGELEKLLGGYACYVESVDTKTDYDNEWILYVDVLIYFSLTEKQKTFSSYYSLSGYTPDEIASDICDDIVKSFDFPERFEKESEKE